ncbi:MAG: transcriptional activator NhaR [Labilithrix sp.]|nr:transcriptional activator NhaR [Labilithrix sp.]MBX3220051.1 transcriptional activator NhaR [Labilithrix sp.]
MQRLNFHHLRYFWLVAREGGLANAGKLLKLSPAALSTQIRSLEESVGHRLFTKQGRRLVLTEVGHIAYRYADDIFALGRELGDVLERRVLPSAATLRVGLVEALPKMVVRHLLEPVLRATPPARLVCHEGTVDALIAGLASHAYDLVLADTPLPAGSAVRAYNHLLGDCGVTFFAQPDTARLLRSGFPESLNQAPMLLPATGSALRRELDAWFDARGVVPRVVAEFEDSALLKAFGAAGHGVFCVPSVIATEIASVYAVAPVGETRDVLERFYAISPERRIRNPAVAAISDAARESLFG